MAKKKCPYRLRSCVWEITLACCFRCAYCGSCGGAARDNELSTEECISVAKQLSELGCRRVSLIGGEVFMRKDWETIVRALTDRGIAVCIITNGFTLSEEIMNALKSCNIESVAVSIDGPEPIHDAFRQKGSYKRAFAALQAVLDNGIPASVISALRADNYKTLPEFYDTLKNYGIFAWQIQACSPMGNAKKNELDVTIDANYVIKFIESVLPAAPFAVGIADNIGYYTENERMLRGSKNACFGGCSAGLTTIGIDSVGNVRGCESMYDERFIEGNLRERSLRDIWEDENAFAYNRKFKPSMLTGECAKCKYGDICAGGCRSYNYFTNDGKLYENILCARSKGK